MGRKRSCHFQKSPCRPSSAFFGSLSGFLDKAAAHAGAKKIDPAVLLGTRLFPHMFPLARQVQLASDFAKGTTARLAGSEPPKYADEEKTFEELKARLARATDYLVLSGLPNFYFHVTTAYNILRHCGVELSKRDFLGVPANS